MDKNLKKFMETPTRSRAQILDDHFVEVQTPDGEIFKFISDLAKYDSCEYITIYSGVSHKGNCKFCKERDSIKWEKRKKELEELVLKLKER